MLITDLDADLKPFRDVIDDFADQYLAPTVKDNDRYPFDHTAADSINDRFERLFQMGLLGITMPAALGGTEQGVTALCMALSRIAEVDASYAGFIFTSALSQELLLRTADNDYLTALYRDATAARDCAVAFCAFTNPAQLTVLPTAMRSNTGYVLSGISEYVVLGSFSRRAIVPAILDDQPVYSLYLVDLDQSGVRRSDPIVSLGLHALPAVDVTLTNAHGILLGNAGDGSTYFDAAASVLHVGSAAIAAGIMRASFTEAHDYARHRRQGGRTIINWSEVQMMLANMHIRSTNADLLLAQCGRELDTGTGAAHHSRAAALLVHEMAAEVVTDGVQVLGGNGYTKDYGQEKRYRDARQVQCLLGAHSPKKIALLTSLPTG